MSIKAKYIFYIGAFIILIILGIIFLPKDEILIIEKNEKSQNSGDDFEDVIFVHIDGEVNEPGIKKIKKGTRIFKLIELSGGETTEADLSRLNLSSILKDEQKIIVPRKVEEMPFEENFAGSGTSSKATNSSSTSFPININYATSKELEALTGIGPSMATKIVSYRDENGLFNSIEEIKNVSGIGEAKYNKIKDYITTWKGA